VELENLVDGWRDAAQLLGRRLSPQPFPGGGPDMAILAIASCLVSSRASMNKIELDRLVFGSDII
jgi:hypothetical protein